MHSRRFSSTMITLPRRKDLLPVSISFSSSCFHLVFPTAFLLYCFCCYATGLDISLANANGPPSCRSTHFHPRLTSTRESPATSSAGSCRTATRDSTQHPAPIFGRHPTQAALSYQRSETPYIFHLHAVCKVVSTRLPSRLARLALLPPAHPVLRAARATSPPELCSTRPLLWVGRVSVRSAAARRPFLSSPSAPHSRPRFLFSSAAGLYYHICISTHPP